MALESAAPARLQPARLRAAIRRIQGRRIGVVLGLYAASRVYSTALLVVAYLCMPAEGRGSFFDFSGRWDGVYYRSIAEHGYPATLPTDEIGRVVPNPWAFLPVYPAIVRAVTATTGLGFYPVAEAMSLLFGAAASVLLYLLVSERVGHRSALFVVGVFAAGPLGFILQTAYAESLFFALAFAAVYCLQRRYYWLMALAGLVACFTRPGGVAIAMAAAVVLYVRLRGSRWGRDRVAFPVGERVALLVGGGAVGAAGLAWPLVAGAVTHVPSAYLDTELSWREPFLGHVPFLPFASWFEFMGLYLGAFGVALVGIAVAAIVYWLTRPRLRRLGTATLSFVASFGLYLFAVFLPQQSFFRVVMPAVPLLADPVVARRPRTRRAVFWVSLGLQPVAIVLLWCFFAP